MCTGGFTKDAANEARTQEKRRVTLIGLETLFDLWVEHYDKLTDQARRRLPLRPIQFLSPGGWEPCAGVVGQVHGIQHAANHICIKFDNFPGRWSGASTAAVQGLFWLIWGAVTPFYAATHLQGLSNHRE